MARIRTIKPEFFTSPGTAAVDFPVRIFYEALWCAADDFGIGETNFNALLGLAFPDSDGFSAQDVRRFCADCAQHYGTIFYAVRGRHFYYIPTWDKHQKTERRETRRRFPTPDDLDAIPDQRIYGGADFAPDSPRKSGADSRENVAGTGEQGNRGTGENNPPTPLPAEIVDTRDAESRNDGRGKALARFGRMNECATSPASWDIARAFTASNGAAPLEEQAKIAASVEKCLRAGVSPEQITAGLNLWAQSDSWAASQIGAFVTKAGQRSTQPNVSKATQKAMNTHNAAEALIAEMEATR